jgi:predicted ester cyclase
MKGGGVEGIRIARRGPPSTGSPVMDHRHPLLFVVAACALGACGSSDVNQPAPPPVDARIYQQSAVRAVVAHKTAFETEREALDAFGRAFVQPDMKPGLAPLLDPDADFSFPGMADATDREGLLRSLGDLFGAFSSRKYAPSRIWQVGEAAIVEWTMLGAQSGDWMGVKATGKQVGIRGITMHWFNLNGLINEVHLYFDVGAVLTQLGAGPKGAEVSSLPALASSPVVVVASGGETEKSNIGTLKASFDALEAKNEAGYLAPMADDIEVYRLDRLAIERGKEERRKHYRAITRAITSLAQTPLNSWGVDTFAIEEYTVTGVHSGPLNGIPPSGHAIRLHMVDVCDMRDGKIARVWSYSNSMEVMAEIGNQAPPLH